jgi:hydrogenase expression/formation protein HypC
VCVGIPGRLIEIDDAARRLATVEVAGVRRQVNIACIVDSDHSPQSRLGAWVLIHVGFAMSVIDEHEAQRTLDLLRELGEAQGELEAAASLVPVTS